MPLLMFKDNYVVEPTLWLEYASQHDGATFDDFIERMLT